MENGDESSGARLARVCLYGYCWLGLLVLAVDIWGYASRGKWYHSMDTPYRRILLLLALVPSSGAIVALMCRPRRLIWVISSIALVLMGIVALGELAFLLTFLYFQ